MADTQDSFSFSTESFHLRRLVNYLIKSTSSQVKINGEYVDRGKVISWLEKAVRDNIRKIENPSKQSEILRSLDNLDHAKLNPTDFLKIIDKAITDFDFYLIDKNLDNQPDLRDQREVIKEKVSERLRQKKLEASSESGTNLNVPNAADISVKQSIEIARKNMIARMIEEAKFEAANIDPKVKEITQKAIKDTHSSLDPKLTELVIKQRTDELIALCTREIANSGKVEPEVLKKIMRETMLQKPVPLTTEAITNILTSVQEIVTETDQAQLVKYHQNQTELAPKFNTLSNHLREKYGITQAQADMVVQKLDENLANGFDSANSLEKSLQLAGVKVTTIQVHANLDDYSDTLGFIDRYHNADQGIYIRGRKVSLDSFEINGKKVSFSQVHSEINQYRREQGKDAIGKSELESLMLNNDAGLTDQARETWHQTRGNLIRYNEGKFSQFFVGEKVDRRNIFEWSGNNNVNLHVQGERIIGRRLLSTKRINQLRQWSMAEPGTISNFQSFMGKTFVRTGPSLGQIFSSKMLNWAGQDGIKGGIGKIFNSFGFAKDQGLEIGKTLLTKIGGEKLVGALPGLGTIATIWKHRDKIIAGLGATAGIIAHFMNKGLIAGIGATGGALGGAFLGLKAGLAITGALTTALGPIGLVIGIPITIITTVGGAIIGALGGGWTGWKLSDGVLKGLNGIKDAWNNAGNFFKNLGQNVGEGLVKGIGATTAEAAALPTQMAVMAVGGVMVVGLMSYFNLQQIYNAFFLPALDKQGEYNEFVNYCAGAPMPKPNSSDKLNELLKKISNETNVDPDILAAILRVETGLTYFVDDPESVTACPKSACGAVGPMQITRAFGYISSDPSASTCNPRSDEESCVNCDPGTPSNKKATCESYCKVCNKDYIKNGETCIIGKTFVTNHHIAQFNTWGTCSGDPCKIEDALRCATEILKRKAGVSSFQRIQSGEKAGTFSDDTKIAIARAVVGYHGESYSGDVLEFCVNKSKTWPQLGGRSYCQFVLEWIDSNMYTGSEMMTGFASGYPIEHGSITQGVGGSFSHHGTIANSIDIGGGADGLAVKPTHAGIVTQAVVSTSKVNYGTHVIVQGTTADGKMFETLYGHLMPGLEVSVGQQVTQNTILGYVNNTGYSTGSHLHYELRNTSDPSLYRILLGCTLPLDEQAMQRVNGGCGDETKLCNASF